MTMNNAESIVTAMIIGKSRFNAAFTLSCPSPGHPNTNSITNDPDTIWGIDRPISVTIGNKAFRSA